MLQSNHTRFSYLRKVTRVPLDPWIHAENRSAVQVAIGNQVDSGLRKSVPGFRKGKSVKFGFPRLPQAGFGGTKVSIVVAGVAYEFPSALRNAGGDGAEQGFIEHSGDLDAQGSIRCGETLFLRRGAETGGKALQHPHLGIAGPEAGPGKQLA
jgi:hypothetical protein